MKPISIGVVGFGTVGSGVVKILLENKDLISQRVGREVVVSKVADIDITRDRGFAVPKDILTDDYKNILADPDIDIVVETMGGIGTAQKMILQAIDKEKHVVTANKALLAEAGDEIFSAAFEKGVDINFEASVGGGIPIIRTLKEGLVGDNVRFIFGITNGTCNYILTRMTEDGMEFADALKMAQELGYAEADPTLDVEGFDSAHKLAITIPLTYGVKIPYKDIYVEGISHVDALDITFAGELGYKIKLLSILVNTPDGIEARVHPTLIPFRYLLSNVNYNMNAFYIRGEAVGNILLYGQGAGMMPTGTAVVSDVVELARNVSAGISERVPPLSFRNDAIKTVSPKPMDEVTTNFYLRFDAKDRPGVLSKISGILGAHDISIVSVIQKGRAEDLDTVPVVMMTHEAKEKNIRSALREIDDLDIVEKPSIFYRVEDTNLKEKTQP
ncbi:MAG: homoserine dehydrogenase [Deltaproteobacteria bacterium]|nr:homoserine dehydrogenase [Candidatus Zymogenaceae bacterium]